MGRNQQQPGPNSIFLQAWNLYTSCKRSGTWAKLVLECDVDGMETFSFSSKRPSDLCYPDVADPPQPTPPTQSTKRKTPSKLRKDRVKWRAWLERKLLETTNEPCREEYPSQSGESAVPPPVSSCAPPASLNPHTPRYTHVQGDQGHSSFPPSSSNEEDTNVYGLAISYLNSIPDSSPNETVTTPLGSTFTTLQPLAVCQGKSVGGNPVGEDPAPSVGLTNPRNVKKDVFSGKDGDSGKDGVDGKDGGHEQDGVREMIGASSAEPARPKWVFVRNPKQKGLDPTKSQSYMLAQKQKQSNSVKKPDLYHSKFNS